MFNHHLGSWSKVPNAHMWCGPQARDLRAVRDAGGYRAATTASPAESGVQQEQRGHQDHPGDH